MNYPQKWDLSSVYPSIECKEFQGDLQSLETAIAPLVAQVLALPTESVPGPWEAFFTAWEAQGLLMNQVGVYVNCLASADTEDPRYPALLGNLSSLGAKAAEISIHLRQKLGTMGQTTYESLLANSPKLKEIRFSLDEIRTQAQYMMDGPREKLAADLGVDGITAWGRLYTTLSGKLKVHVMEKSVLVEKSVGQVRTDSAEPTVRKNNFYAADKAWQKIEDSCAGAINAIAGTRLTLYKNQGYHHFLDKPLQDNRLNRTSLEAMWQAVSDRKTMLVPYLQKKARILGLEKLAWYDQVAPLGTGTIDFDSAADLVVQEFSKFSPDMGTFAQQALEKGFVESEDRTGKRPGAYCTKFLSRKEPRVSMTFSGTYDSMSTLAYELGHAYHGFILKDQSIPLQTYVMSTAETASTFAEEIVTDYLIGQAPNPRDRLAMLDKSLADAMIMMMNIHARFLFESEFYTARAKGEVRVDQLNDLMLQAQKTAFLDQLSAYDPRFWVNKLHFYISGLSFYNFPYTFGYLFSTGLFARAKVEGPAFTDTYKKILLATGTMNTEEVIRSTLGEDIGQVDFWNKSLDLIETRVQEFCTLADQM